MRRAERATRGVLLLALLLAAGCAGEPADVLPAIDAWDGEPQVAAAIEAAREEALAAGTAESIGRLGETFHAHDLFVEAAVCYRRAAELAPAEGRWPYLAALATAKGDLEAAVELFESALAAGLEHPPLHVHFGDVLQQLGRFAEAERHYRRALALEPQANYALLGLAQIARDADPAVAVGWLEQAATIAPWHGEVHAALAQAYQRLGRENDAELAQLRAAAFDQPSRPSDPILAVVETRAVSSTAHRIAGRRFAAQGRYAEAEEQFRKVLAIISGTTLDHANLGGALTGLGRFDEAIAALDLALELDPEDAFAHNNRGMALAGKGDLTGAVTALERAIASDPGYAEAHHNLGLVRERQGRQREAIGHYQRALEHNPSLTQAYVDLGTALGRLGRLDEAMAQWRRAVDIDAHALTALFNLAQAHIMRGEHEDAVARLRRAIEIAPNSSRVVALLAWELATAPVAELRRPAEAEQLVRRVYDAYPEEPRSGDTLAAALAALGRFDEAQVLARAALAQAKRARRGPLAAQIGQRLKLYQLGQPFVQPPVRRPGGEQAR